MYLCMYVHMYVIVHVFVSIVCVLWLALYACTCVRTCVCVFERDYINVRIGSMRASDRTAYVIAYVIACVSACLYPRSRAHVRRWVLNNISHVAERFHKVNLVRHRQLCYLFQMIRPVTGHVVTPVPLSMVATAASATKASCLRTTKCPACVRAFLSMSV